MPHASAPRPALLLVVVAAALALLIGLVGSGGRTSSRPRPIPSGEPWSRREPAGERLRAPLVLPPLEDEAAPSPAPVKVKIAEQAPESREERARLVGFVLRPEGEPATGARVLLGHQQARCDGNGRFELALTADANGADLLAFEPGHEPALRPAFGTGLALRGESQVRLVLGPETLALAGTVVGQDGEPRKGWTVELDGLDPLATYGLREALRTDGEGRFQLSEVPAGVHIVRAWKERRELAYRSVPSSAGESGLTIVVAER